MKRERIGVPIYYTSIGGAIEQNENEIVALKRELLEESGSIIDVPVFVFKLIDGDSESIFYQANEIDRIKPTGEEWSVRNNPNNKYEIVEMPKDQAQYLNIVPTALKDFLISKYC